MKVAITCSLQCGRCGGRSPEIWDLFGAEDIALECWAIWHTAKSRRCRNRRARRAYRISWRIYDAVIAIGDACRRGAP